MATYEEDLKAAKLIALIIFCVNFIYAYSLFHIGLCLLFGVPPSIFVSFSPIVAYLIERYMHVLFARYNFDVHDVVQKRIKELDDEDDEGGF